MGDNLALEDSEAFPSTLYLSQDVLVANASEAVGAVELGSFPYGSTHSWMFRVPANVTFAGGELRFTLIVSEAVVHLSDGGLASENLDPCTFELTLRGDGFASVMPCYKMAIGLIEPGDYDVVMPLSTWEVFPRSLSLGDPLELVLYDSLGDADARPRIEFAGGLATIFLIVAE